MKEVKKIAKDNYLKELKSGLNVTKMLYLILGVVTCVFGFLIELSITFIFPFFFSLILFSLNWYSLIKQSERIGELEWYDIHDSN